MSLLRWSREGNPRWERIERGGNQTAIVFVHGLFGDFRETWGRFPELICQDAELNHCDVICWGYPSSVLGPLIKFLGHQVPTIDQVSEALRTDLENTQIAGKYTDLILVGHSMGGLVLMKLILSLRETLQENAKITEEDADQRKRLLRRVKHLVLYATPTQGVQLPKMPWRHRQIVSLGDRSQFITDVTKGWQKKDLQTTVPVKGVVGLQDNAVTEQSASAFWRDVKTAPGNHTEVVKPGDRSHTSFDILRQVICDSTIPRFANGRGEVIRINIQLVQEAEKEIYTIGSRSRDEKYLAAIEKRLQEDPKLVYYRVLMGPPRHQVLKEHLSKILSLRDPQDRTHGYQTVHLAMYHDLVAQPEVFLCGTERRCLVVLPAATGKVGEYSTGVVFTESSVVQGYHSLTKALYDAAISAGYRLETKSAVAKLNILAGA
jgi:pimeloyl-ACP methyl ester carboxylesterase